MRSVLLILALAGAFARADDLVPPSWRGAPGTTFQHWSFPTADPAATPDAGLFNPYGTPFLTVNSSANWQAAALGRAGVWTLPGDPAIGAIGFLVPNALLPGAPKLVWMQVTWAALPGSSSSPRGMVVVGTTPYQLSFVGELSLPNGWKHWVLYVELPRSPSLEEVFLFPNGPLGGIYVDQVVLDTFAVPEPGTLVCATIGLAGLVLRRRSAGSVRRAER